MLRTTAPLWAYPIDIKPDIEVQPLGNYIFVEHDWRSAVTRAAVPESKVAALVVGAALGLALGFAAAR